VATGKDSARRGAGLEIWQGVALPSPTPRRTTPDHGTKVNRDLRKNLPEVGARSSRARGGVRSLTLIPRPGNGSSRRR
jgi:hypothetical protein